MDYKVVYTKNSQKDLAKIDAKIAKQILQKVYKISLSADPLKEAKKLKGFKHETYRFRAGDYRIVFRHDPKTNNLVILVILRIAHRKEIYKKL